MKNKSEYIEMSVREMSELRLAVVIACAITSFASVVWAIFAVAQHAEGIISFRTAAIRFVVGFAVGMLFRRIGDAIGSKKNERKKQEDETLR